MTLNVGLVGYGLAGRYLHAPLIKAAGFTVAGVVTSRGDHVRTDFPDAAVFSSIEDVCASPDINVVVIATPDHLHVTQAQLALQANKHVVIDKPFAPTSEEALALIEASETRGVVLTVFQNRRWDNDFLTVQKLIAQGALGDVVHYTARWDRFRPDAKPGWREDYMLGELYGLGSHLVDQALTLFGVPDWVTGDVYKQRTVPGHSDGFEILMGKGRLRISLGVNLLAADELRSFRVLGTRGAFTKSGLDPQEMQLRARRSIAFADHGVEPLEASGALFSGPPHAQERIASQRGDWLAFYLGVRNAIESGASVPVPAREAARVIAVLEAVQESSLSGRRVDLADWLGTRSLA